jgi:hypothetical protein
MLGVGRGCRLRPYVMKLFVYHPFFRLNLSFVAQVVFNILGDPAFRPALPPRDALPCLPAWADLESYVALMRECWAHDPNARWVGEGLATRRLW